MRILESLQQKIGFTRNEALAVLILSGTFLAGVTIRWVQSSQPAQPQKRFDYTRSDSMYAARWNRATDSSHASRLPSVQPKGTNLRKANQIVNINSATKSQLMSLPGIGPSFADRIIEYRKMHGRFSSVEDLLNVKGIGKKKLEKLRPFVAVK